MDEITTVVITLITFLVAFTLPVAGIIIFLIKTNTLREKNLSKLAVVFTSIHGAYNLLVLLAIALFFIGIFSQTPHASLANDPGAVMALYALMAIVVLGIPSAGIGTPTGALNAVISASCIKRPETRKKGIICTAVSALSFLVSLSCLGLASYIIFFQV